MTQPVTVENSTVRPNSTSSAWFHRPNSPRWNGMPIAVAFENRVWSFQSE